ncbi:MAG TPA: hypothetical protein VH394_30165 [Thermoanaerobaculia bacterium]|nr:hypothetical protein [Thermoanaerobaculia bacterium]
MKRVLMLGLLALMLAATVAQATTVLYVPVKKSIQLSDYVLVGSVTRLEPAYDAEGQIVTRVHLLVEESLKGDIRSGEEFIFTAWGGSLDGMTTETVGEARYNLGEKVMVQLESIQGEYHTLGLSFGKWSVVRENDGSSTVVRSLFDLNMVGLNEVPVTKMPLGRMREIARQTSY